MSKRDWKRDGALVRGLFGLPLTCALPTNSIKLMADPEEHRRSFVWIDPPWQLLKGDRFITGAADYPDPELPEYLALHEAWGAVVMPLLNGAVLEAVTQLGDESTEFRFQGDVRVQVGDGGEPQGWYDDWYLKRSRSADAGSRPQ